MNIFDSTSPALSYQAAYHCNAGSARRLIVLAPVEADFMAVAQRVWELANALESRVQFLGLYEDTAQESVLRRQLVTMSAMIQDDKIQSEVLVEKGSDWVSAIRSHLQKGDLVVCFSGQRRRVFQRPLNNILEANLGAPIYIIPGSPSSTYARSNWLWQVVVWMGLIGIVAGATLLQIRIAMLPNDWIQTTLMILSVIVEAWLVWVWNGFFD